MQVSIYLDSETVRRVDQKARQTKKSRSEFVQSILKSVLFGGKRKTVFDEVFGLLSPSEARNLLQTIHKSRLDSPRFG